MNLYLHVAPWRSRACTHIEYTHSQRRAAFLHARHTSTHTLSLHPLKSPYALSTRIDTNMSLYHEHVPLPHRLSLSPLVQRIARTWHTHMPPCHTHMPHAHATQDTAFTDLGDDVASNNIARLSKKHVHTALVQVKAQRGSTHA
jgi:hypothetical protein